MLEAILPCADCKELMYFGTYAARDADGRPICATCMVKKIVTEFSLAG
jgi:formylmethanofuran dehydrogenase subunit E